MNKKSGWQLSGDGPDAYEKYIVPAYTRAWAKEIVDRACLGEGEKILDVILCQQGLQYFPDPSLALKEMNRVLVENGRILLSVWRPIQYSPFYESLCKVLEKYVNVKAASMLSAAFNLGDYGNSVF